MSSPYNLPDYRERFFEYKDLTKIHGQPTIDSILQIVRQLKRNSQGVRTTLGGGQMGYLALVIDAASYNAIPGAVPFVRPLDPGLFTPIVPVGVRAVPLTAADIATQKITFDEEKRRYNECQAIEVALRNQVTEAIEDEYLQPLRNVTTDMIHTPIPDIFTFLGNTYGKLSPQQLRQREKVIDDIIFDPTKNVDTVFNKIQEFQDLCQLLRNSKTDTQLVIYAYLCFQKANIFQNSLIKWNARAAVNQTFSEFKLFMREEYQALEAVGGLTVDTLSINLIRELKEHQESFANNLKNEIQDGIYQTLQTFNISSANQENIPPNIQSSHPITQFGYTVDQPAFYQNSDPNSVNQVTNGPSLAQLLKEMQEMRTTITNLTMVNNQHSQQIGEDKSVNPRTGQPWKRYCWSCGLASHWSKNCSRKLKGHQDDAVFKNRMGGSNLNCK